MQVLSPRPIIINSNNNDSKSSNNIKNSNSSSTNHSNNSYLLVQQVYHAWWMSQGIFEGMEQSAHCQKFWVPADVTVRSPRTCMEVASKLIASGTTLLMLGFF